MKIFRLSFILIVTIFSQLDAQYATTDSSYDRWFVGSSFFVFLGNLDTENPPNFFQLNIGYRITGRDVITIEPKTWKYAWPNGIHPFLNKAYKKPEEKFPGYVREYGISVSYQRFLWDGFYAELNVMPTVQNYVYTSGNNNESGFQIFNTYRVGYHIKLLKDRLFIQPSIAITHRPYHTTLPDGFKQLDDKWSKFIFGEPGFHFGYNL